MIDIIIQTADIGALSVLLTADPSPATEGLVLLTTQPPVAAEETLHRMAEILLFAGADPNHHEALYHACEHPHHAILDAILASPRLERPWLSYCFLRKLDFDDILGLQKMLKAGVDPNLRSRQGDREMSLHHAIRRGRAAATIDLLRAHGASPDIINIHNHTARRQAIRFGRTDLGSTASEATDLDYWLHQLWHQPAATPAPAPLSQQDHRLLPEAAWMQDYVAVTNMLQAGFPIGSQTHSELRALDFAAYHSDEKLAQILIDYGASREDFETAKTWLSTC